MPKFHALLHRCCIALAVLTSTALHAAALEDAQALWAAGKRDLAVKATEDALKATPDDPRLRFALGTMLLEQRQLERARAVFTSLTEDYPDLAAPYNNLAVIHAARGEYEAARQQLMRALELQPDHAQAQENLGDVLLRLAQQAYERALKQPLGDDSALRLKLQRVSDLNSGKRPSS